MKMRRFFGLTSRSVLEQVRAELGPDAVILGNHSTAEGIEITAMAGEAMANLLHKQPAGEARAAFPLAEPVPPSAPVVPTDMRLRRAVDAVEQPVMVATATGVAKFGPVANVATPASTPVDATSRSAAVAAIVRAQVLASTVGTEAPVHAAAPAVVPAPLHATPAAVAQVTSAVPGLMPAPAARDGVSSRLMSEMAALRQMLEQQLSQFAWNDVLRRTPLRASFMRDLLHAGFGAEHARSLVARLPDHLSPTDAQQWIASEIAAGIPCAGPDADIVALGGVYALTGTTGVGKTTTAAKLAARCAVRHGASSLALLTTDSYRVGAHDQLRIYARILGVTVHTVNGTEDLRQALDSLRAKHLVLVDTVGMGQRDARVQEHAMLLAQPEVKRLVVLAATAQAETLEEVVHAYRPAADGTDAGFAGCILTKLDEAVRLGDALDVVVRHRLPLHYLSTGQRVPEDLHVPNVAYLTHRALRSGAKSRARQLQDDDVGLVLGGMPPPHPSRAVPARVAHA